MITRAMSAEFDWTSSTGCSTYVVLYVEWAWCPCCACARDARRATQRDARGRIGARCQVNGITPIAPPVIRLRGLHVLPYHEGSEGDTRESAEC